jgi:hypothetical protein
MYCIGKALDPRYQETASDISSNEKWLTLSSYGNSVSI